MRTDRVKNELQHLSLNKGNAAQAQAVEPPTTNGDSNDCRKFSMS